MLYLPSTNRIPHWLAIFAAAIAIAGPAIAQTTGDAAISGLVKDPSGSAISGATVSLVNPDTGVTRTFKSDADGRYRFAAVLPGSYSLRVEAPGFSTETISGIVLNIGAYVDHDVSLTVGGVQESVTVTGEI